MSSACQVFVDRVVNTGSANDTSKHYDDVHESSRHNLWSMASLAPSSYFSLMLVPQELVNELGIGQNQQIGLALFAIAWWICRTTPHITSDSCSNFMLTHAGRWGIFAAGGLFVKLTAGLRVRQKALFFQSLAFAIITLAFVAKRVPEESEAIN